MSGPVPISSNSIHKSPGPHAEISAKSITEKPNLPSPPQPKSPMPPTASLSSTSTELLDRDTSQLTPLQQQQGQQQQHHHHQNEQSNEGARAVSSGMKADSSSSSAANTIPSPPAEVEATLSKLTSHANVIGVLVLSRPEALIIRSGGAYFEPSGPGARERAMRLKNVVEMVRNAVLGLERDIPKSEVGDELAFLRIRTKKYELMISPSEKYLLVVLQDPTVSP